MPHFISVSNQLNLSTFYSCLHSGIPFQFSFRCLSPFLFVRHETSFFYFVGFLVEIDQIKHGLEFLSFARLRRLCFYRCLSVHGDGGLPGPGPGGCPGPSPGGCLPRGVSRPRPGGVCPRGGPTPPPPQQTATAGDGTHPTGMHSCIS